MLIRTYQWCTAVEWYTVTSKHFHQEYAALYSDNRGRQLCTYTITLLRYNASTENTLMQTDIVTKAVYRIPIVPFEPTTELFTRYSAAD